MFNSLRLLAITVRVRLIVLASVLVISIGLGLHSSRADAQVSGSTSADYKPNVAPNGLGTPQPAARGGGSLADFSELTNLIETIVPGNWEVDGGEDTIQPFANGVWIDLKGKLQRRPVKDIRLPKAVASQSPYVEFDLDVLRRIQSSEKLRWIALNDIEAAIRDAVDSRTSASAEAKLLGGLTRIEYLVFDREKASWLIGGPAGDLVLTPFGDLVGRETGLPPVLLEDLLALAPHVLNGKSTLGCSIDPVPERLKAASDLASSPLAAKSLTRQADQWCKKLVETLGDQKATVFGLDADSPTAIALLVADEHMKRMGLGLETPPAKVLSYWDHSERIGAIPSKSMIRWWFALPNNIDIETDEAGMAFRLSGPTVQVLSQDQWLDATGKRQDIEARDLAAENFARGFTENYEAIQRSYPAIHGRLRHIFDLCIVLQLIREESRLNGLPPLATLADPAIQPHANGALQWLPSIAAWRKVSSGRVAAIVSGGVAIEVRKTKLLKVQEELQLSSTKIPFALK